MRLCGQVTRYARITGRVKYDVAAGLTEALTPVQTTHFAAVTLPDDIGQLLRDIDAYMDHSGIAHENAARACGAVVQTGAGLAE